MILWYVMEKRDLKSLKLVPPMTTHLSIHMFNQMTGSIYLEIPLNHSSESESESISVPNEMSASKSVITNEKVVSESKEVEPSCATHVKTPRQQMKNQGTSEVKGKIVSKMKEREARKDHPSQEHGGQRHKVLFTKTECLVVSPDFKMPDENQILLKVPRQNNMYSFDMKINLVLSKRLACIAAKATSMNLNCAQLTLPTTFLGKAVSTLVISLIGTSEVTNSAGTLQTLNTNAFEEEDEAEELTVVPTAVRHTTSKVGPRKSSTNSKAEEFLTELQNLKTQEKEAYSTGISEDTPEILAFRREFDELASKHLREVPKNNVTSTTSVNSGSGLVNTQDAAQDDSDMPELTIFNKPQKGIFDEASYDDEGMVHDFNNLPTEVVVSPIPTLRIHNIHPQSQILGDPKSSVQTRSRVQQNSGAHALVSYVQKQQRNNYKDQQHCLFAYFLSQEEPKKISKSLKNDS
ncbi:hypothetical protein Tco_0836117 [Tanacetum coccineum]